jgi:glycosyltransferase involved in cell wall biosynthesis
MKQKLTLTIGIPVHNEEGNISHLLDSVFAQKSKNYTLKKVLIVDDFSDDRTIEVAKIYKKKYPVIQILADKKRLGKCNRLNEIYKKNTSDILITFDGDIILANKNSIDNAMKKFQDEKVGLVTFNDLPVKPQTFAQKIVTAHYLLWNEIRKNYNDGNTVYNVHGNAQALRGDFAKKITYPPVTADQDFLYFSTILNRVKLVHAIDAKVYFRPAGTIHEHYFQTSRFLNEKKAIEDYFGTWVWYIYRIPAFYKLKKAFTYFLKNPLYSFLAAIVYTRLVFFKTLRDPLTEKGMWTQVQTTKGAILVSGHEISAYLVL